MLDVLRWKRDDISYEQFDDVFDNFLMEYIFKRKKSASTRQIPPTLKQVAHAEAFFNEVFTQCVECGYLTFASEYVYSDITLKGLWTLFLLEKEVSI